MPRGFDSRRECELLLSEINRRLGSSPLSEIARYLSDELQFHSRVVENDPSQESNFRLVVEGIRRRIEILPSSFGSRFHIDAALIQAIAEEWSGSDPGLSRMIVPKYGREWGHAAVPVSTGMETHSIAVIELPGADFVDGINLLDYPWISHELGHALHSRTSAFADAFRPTLDSLVSELRRLGVADRGAARSRNATRIQDLESFWTPGLSQANWPYEMAVDVVALWSCGPAYTTTLEHHLRQSAPDPFAITAEHPPYLIRVLAVINAASQLGWRDYLDDLCDLHQQWGTSAIEDNRCNRLLAMSHSSLIESAVTHALQVCHQSNLPRLKPDHLLRLQSLVQESSECDYGMELLVAAWLADRELSESEYSRWQRTVIEELARAIDATPEFR